MMPAGHAYAAAISACAVGSVWPRAVELFDEMMEVNIKPDVVSCTALISALGSDAQWERAERVIVWMHQVGRLLCHFAVISSLCCPVGRMLGLRIRDCGLGVIVTALHAAQIMNCYPSDASAAASLRFQKAL